MASGMFHQTLAYLQPQRQVAFQNPIGDFRQRNLVMLWRDPDSAARYHVEGRYLVYRPVKVRTITHDKFDLIVSV